MRQYAVRSSSLVRLAWALVLAVVLEAVGEVQATSEFPNPTPQGNSWAPCSFAADQVAAEGNGSTYGSCLACDPTSFVCPAKCQSLLDALYEQCDGVYTPQDEYFDPAQTLTGFWNDHFGELRVQAARCGCSDAKSSHGQQHLVLVLTASVLAIGLV